MPDVGHSAGLIPTSITSAPAKIPPTRYVGYAISGIRTVLLEEEMEAELRVLSNQLWEARRNHLVRRDIARSNPLMQRVNPVRLW